MKRTLHAAGAALILAMAVPGIAQGAFSGSAQLNYKILPTVKAQIVPNFASGFGPQGGLGSGSTPTPGPNAVLSGGTVDFGNVVVGYQYLYKYAAQISVQTNDTAGFVVYGEGATDLNGSNPVPSPATFPIFSTLYWLPSSSGNTPFSPATSFNKTSGTPIGANGQNGISYAGAPPSSSSVWSSPTAGNLTQGFDYELRLPGAIPASQFNVYIVYTVIGN
ncbi:MAG TPA: hypothetical protein VHT05_10625 [Candidatus Elarobacter sp.]|nr:hypothetical protein [Candidatus Elarobacter sp.]